MSVQANIQSGGNFTIEDIFCPYVRKEHLGRQFYCNVRAEKYGVDGWNCIYSPEDRKEAIVAEKSKK